jgi:hypothetical protein
MQAPTLFRPTAPDTRNLFAPGKGAASGLFAPSLDEDQLLSFLPSLLPDQDSLETPLSYRKPRKFHPLVLFFLGRRGAGKTLAMTYLALFMQAVYKRLGSNRRIFSTYWLSFADESGPRMIDAIYANPFAYRNSIVLIDEVADFVPSKRAMAGFAVNFESWTRQIRKLGVEILMATQFPQDIMRGVLRQCDLFVRCRSVLEGLHVDLDIYDWWGNYTGDQRSKPWPPEPDTHDWEKTLVFTNQVWGMYDTDEWVSNRWSDYYEQQIAQVWDESGGETATESEKPAAVVTQPADIKIDEVISGWPPEIRVLAKANSIGWSRGKLEDYLRENKLYERTGRTWTRLET